MWSKSSLFVQFKCQNFSDLRASLRVKFGLKVLLRVKELTFHNSASQHSHRPLLQWRIFIFTNFIFILTIFTISIFIIGRKQPRLCVHQHFHRPFLCFQCSCTDTDDSVPVEPWNQNSVDYTKRFEKDSEKIAEISQNATIEVATK